LEDKAGEEYFTLLLERDPQITYPDIIEKLEKRFGFQDVPEISRRSSCNECATCGSSTSVCEYSLDSSDEE
jgi:hypothetical protein